MTQVPYTFGNETSPIPLSQLDANFAVVPTFANVANTVLNPVQANITAVGTLTGLSVSGNVNVGSIVNAGNLSTGNVSSTGYVSATGNVSAGANLFVNLGASIGGSVTAAGLTASGAIDTTSSVSATGNVSAGNVLTGGLISATGNVAGANITAVGTIKASADISTTGNVLAQNRVSAVGNIITDAFFIGAFQGSIVGNITGAPGSNTQVLFNTNGNVDAVGGLTYNKGSNLLTVLGVVSAQGNILGTGNIAITRNASIGGDTSVGGNSSIGGNLTVTGATAISGSLTAPTPIISSANNQVATTAFVNNKVGTLGTMATQNADAVSITGGSIGPASLIGAVTAATAANGVSNTQVATTAFVTNSIVNYFPSGGIIMWSGTIASIPAGWYLCNGSNGTPDLRDRFIVGAGSTYAVSATGGSADAIVVSHTHTASTTVSDPGHRHIFGADDMIASQGGYQVLSGFAYDALSNPGGGGVNAYTKNTAGVNTGEATGIGVSTSLSSTGSSGTNANLPPYYALAFIMKA